MKAEFGNLCINEFINAPTSLNNSKKVDDLYIGLLKNVPVDFKKLADVVTTLLKIKFNTVKVEVNEVDQKITDVNTLIHINQYNKDKQYLEKKI